MSTLIQITKPTELIVNNTPITGGVAGRVLFEGTGNVLQQSSSLFWDDAQVRFQLGTTSTRILNFRPEDTTGAYGNSSSIRGGNGNGRLDFYSATNITELRDNIIILTSVGGPSVQVGSSSIALNLGGTRLQVAPTTGNVLINTTTDAGFRLDVNGTARVQGNTTVALNQNAPTRISITNTTSGNAAGSELLLTSNSSALFALGKVSSSYTLYKIIAAGDGYALNTTNGDIAILNDFATGRIKFAAGASSTAQMTLFSTGNIGINTTTDAGFRLDVNGTARVVNQLTVQGMTVGLGGGAVVSNTVVGNVAFNSNTSGQNNTAIGESALFSNTTGTANVAVGRRALFASNSAQNVALGNDSLRFNTAANNTAVGYFSLYNNTTGASNTSLGHNAGNTTTTGSGNVFIGKDAVALNATDSNQFVVGSSTTNAGSVTSEVNTSTQVWNVVINGVARKILLA